MDRTALAKELIALARTIIAANTFKCPECGTKVLENTGYCLKCKKKVKEAIVKDRKLRELEEKLQKAQETLNFKYDMGLPGAIAQADKAYQAVLKELQDYRRSKEAAVSLDLLDATQTVFLSEEMKGLLNDQVAAEMFSAYLYYMISAWAKSKGLEGFAKWFKTQADDEAGHAMKIFEYLVDTGSDVTLPPIASPKELVNFDSMEDAMRATLDHEMQITKQWQVIGELSKEEANLATQALAQWFMTEQVEEEDITSVLYQRVQLADTGSGLLMIDKELK